MLVTGATGFLGSHVVTQLLKAGARPACFVRPSSDTRVIEATGLPLRVGDLGDVGSLVAALNGVKTLVNLASLGFGHAPFIVEACRLAGIERGVFISTTAIFTKLDARTKAVRLEAERLIRESGLAWTILRPTMIYGTERDRNFARLIRFIDRYPVVPIPGSGRGLQQPVHVDDLAAAVISALDRPASCGRAYNLSGERPLTYSQTVDETATALGRRVIKLHVPLTPVALALRLYERTARRPLIKAEQVLRFDEDKAFPHDEAAADLGFSPRAFTVGITAEVEMMREKGLIRRGRP